MEAASRTTSQNNPPTDTPATTQNQCESAPTFKQWINSASRTQLQQFISSYTSLESQLPITYLSTLKDSEHAMCLRFVLICWHVTRGTQCPRQNQLAAALGISQARDVLFNAGTGCGKTLAAILNQLLEESDGFTMIVSPLKRLQASHASDIERIYGLKTIVINDDTPRDDTYWKEHVHDLKTKTPGSARLFIVTPEQLFRTPEGHFTRFGLLIRERPFSKRNKSSVVDEGHFIHTAGLARYGLPAFRRAYGRLDEIKVILGPRVPWLVLTATAPPHMLRTIENKVLRPDYVSLRVSTNRPDIMYATHQVIGNINNYANYQCFLTTPFSFAQQPRVLIFLESCTGTVQLARYLDMLLPPDLRRRGIVKHYHGLMSPEYLDKAHKDFTAADGCCKILVATSGESVGVDHPDVKIVCIAGLPQDFADKIQKDGRAVRREGMQGLAVLFYDPWVTEINLDEFAGGDPSDLDRPRKAVLKPTSNARERAGFSSVSLVQSNDCIRFFICYYLKDGCPTALNYTTPHCCSNHDDGFNLQEHLPGPIFCEATVGPTKRKHPDQNLIRPVKYRKPLQTRLQAWLNKAHRNDSLAPVRPKCDILDPSDIKTLSRSAARSLASSSDVVSLLSQTSEWEHEWAEGILQVIQNFEEEVSMEELEDDTNMASMAREKRRKVKSVAIIEDSDIDEEELDAILAREVLARERGPPQMPQPKKYTRQAKKHRSILTDTTNVSVRQNEE